MTVSASLDSVTLTHDATDVEGPRRRWYIDPLLALATAGMITLSLEPFGQFYLAWVALVPWMFAIRRGSYLRVGVTSYLTGMMTFALVLMWLWGATIAGTILLLSWLGLYWIAASIAIRVILDWSEDQRLRCGVAALVMIPSVWVALEWVRSWLVMGGFAWGMISQSQSRLTAVCQIADVGGEFAVTYWVIALNAVAFFAVTRRDLKQIFPAAGALAVLTLAVVLYGAFRISQTESIQLPGPRVMVVQPDFPHRRGGERTVGFEQLIKFHFDQTNAALQESAGVDLIAWSETVLPPMNSEAIRRSNNPEFSTKLHERLTELTQRSGASLIFGAYALLSFPKSHADADVRTSTYLFVPSGATEARYDKLHLVPFGEAVPFKKSIPWLHRWLFKFAAYSVQYVITPGTIDELRPFVLPSGVRFVTPICFEDADMALVRQLIYSGGAKRADLIVNISNDGWFNTIEKRQHLAAAIFRSIENRVWTARASNTGISGFIDPAGRFDDSTTIPPNTAAVKVMRVGVDPRSTFYGRNGDVFAVACCVIAVVGAAWACWRSA